MADLHALMKKLQKKNDSKIVLLVSDGLGGLPLEPGGKTELETANTPNLDALAKKGTLGRSIPVIPGITPGSGPGHLGLFGYDPLEFNIGRGVLEALGIDFELGPDDVAIRGNFCTLDDDGKITDRRAGRIPSEVGAELCKKLDKIEIPGVEVFVRHVKEYRLVIVLRAKGLGGDINDTDPQKTGVPPLEPVGQNEASAKTAVLCKEFLKQAGEILKDDHPANLLTMRGIAKMPEIPTFEEVYGTRAAAVAVYPMYRGLARLVSMDVKDAGQTLESQMDCLEKIWDDYDFFFVHYKYTDSTGEDGNFDAKVARTEDVDTCIPRITALNPDVLIVTGDHSTPAKMKSHSWHPVPVLLSAENARFDGCQSFGESECIQGGLGQFEAKYLMWLAMAHAGRLEKYGA
ncbi:2,3-bisphosphoglycerate-independent phosphoglycerate mutase [Gimesia maris]|jgi:2,3-bisphosphoglycerate-independent phosphoglycerate mutase|uniref:2,3-bisphosphoglycerate-independent phosphoglycerate mutase n=1 Tax=Gimesia maris TaxID=122 RepID=A0A3D3RA07_9PLAN|nr:2,3-bisphosphoglycerate-independent phosphoglycerate mutase [Gimesia maris]MAC55820.1 phosphoglycerate mutase [Gimesia sp.]EDL56572.1 cofactor-independent phosphoglycerate mutase [Gimesia maris DSM 8797]QDT81275.1 cofactor-independent phosphoglycerate mutase [Gimesia maris]QEG19058.1 cofactor-independent phosphoglycerate mutase [Gimesia maris]QGQ28052.1 2,3-bisphosphoglycerate-independent phosphoglycerate mutase [Gimesia maris]|tara:strand:+ start:50936 stop:52144 length:1209 start_codon:yes stop_codon:yes gene_type:complete